MDEWMQTTDPIFRYAFARAEERRLNNDMHARIVGTFSQLARELDEITQAWAHSVKV